MEKNSSAEDSVARVRRGLGAFFVVFIVAGWVYPIAGLIALGCMLAGMYAAIAKKSFWCGSACPRGSFLGSWIGLVSRQGPVPAFLRAGILRYGLLAFLLAMISWRISALWPDLYDIGAFLILMVTVTTFAGMMLGYFFQPRTWCSICPVSTIGKMSK